MIKATNIDDYIRGIGKTLRELDVDDFEITWSQDIYDMLYLFVSLNAFKVGHRKFTYLGLMQIRGRKDFKGDFSIKINATNNENKD